MREGGWVISIYAICDESGLLGDSLRRFVKMSTGFLGRVIGRDGEGRIPKEFDVAPAGKGLWRLAFYGLLGACARTGA